MSKGTIYPAESSASRDTRTGAVIRQVTNHPSIHHHPFFFIPAYDDAMQWLFFVSHRDGSPQIFAENRANGTLLQLTERPDLHEWSVHPSHDGRAVFFTAGTSGWRVNLETLQETRLVNFAATRMREDGMVAAAMGTTALSPDDRWWAVSYKYKDQSELMIVDTERGGGQTILRRDSIGHMQFCPDDPTLLFYAGPLQDRVWVVNRDGTGNRRLYARDAAKNEWITHETWIPGRRELAFIDWPNGIRAVHIDTGRERVVAAFNAWHAVCDRSGTRMVADTNVPDVGLQVFDPREEGGPRKTVCYPQASNVGDHWRGPFPYGNGPISVYAPQHTHPHPSFSPDGRCVVFTSDHTGFAQVYECAIPEGEKESNGTAR